MRYKRYLHSALLVLAVFLTVLFAACGKTSGEESACIHLVETDAAVAATCTKEGLTAGSHCALCGEVLTEQKTVAAMGHDAVCDPAVAPTCVVDGKTEGSHCTFCGEVFIAQEAVPAVGTHQAAADAAVAATCIADGKTAGSHCVVCGEILVAQEVISARGHGAPDVTPCALCSKPKTEGLVFALNADGTSYLVMGMGTATSTELFIPATYNNLPVTGIGDGAFENCTTLETVVLPYGIKTIGTSAFERCVGLTSVALPETLTQIADNAFLGCYKLIEVQQLGEGLLSVTAGSMSNGAVGYYASYIYDGTGVSRLVREGDYLFYVNGMEIFLMGYLGKETTQVLPTRADGRAYQVHAYGFYDNDTLTSVTIAPSITRIADNAFFGCDRLSEVIFAKSDALQELGVGAFASCKELTRVTFVDTNTLAGIGQHAFANAVNLAAIALPKGVTTIARGAFLGCEQLVSVSLPKTVKTIGAAAFYGCTQLQTVTVAADSALTSIDANAFFGCTRLASFTVPASVQHIGRGVFASCTQLQTVTFVKLTDWYLGLDEGRTTVEVADATTNAAWLRGLYSTCSWSREFPVE